MSAARAGAGLVPALLAVALQGCPLAHGVAAFAICGRSPLPAWRLRLPTTGRHVPAPAPGRVQGCTCPSAAGALRTVATLPLVARPALRVGRARSRAAMFAREARAAPGQSSGDKASRKAQARAQQIKTMDAKLEGDASFFWQCVARHQSGGTIAGISGLVPVKRDADYLFGERGSEDSAIDFQSYDAIPVKRRGAGESVREVPCMQNFHELAASMPPWAAENLLSETRMRYSAPTPIQRHCVPLALRGHDVCACAQTGSGKTTAYLLPLIASVASSPGRARNGHTNAQPGKGLRLSKAHEARVRAQGTPAAPSALVLAPTRELAVQIELECAKLTFGAPTPPSGAAHWSACAYGGATARPQLETLAAGVEILVATPGRLDDFLQRGLVSLARCRFLVLDEADRMLDMGFEPQIRKIVTRLHGERQTLMFSATFAPPMQRAAEQYLRSAEHTAHVTVGRVGSSMRSIKQALVLVEDGSRRSKLHVLRPLLVPRERTIIFAAKKHVAKWLRTQLAADGTRAVEIHGDRSQGQREAALRQFQDGDADVLVATDVASRGLDVQDVQHVINFDLPTTEADFDAYVHRIGRTGRAGKSGRATSLFVPGDEPKVGNGMLWQPLALVLAENGQQLPPWFEECKPRTAQHPRAVNAATGRTAADGGQTVAGRRKGASANRRARRAAAAAAAGRNPNEGLPRESAGAEGRVQVRREAAVAVQSPAQRGAREVGLRVLAGDTGKVRETRDIRGTAAARLVSETRQKMSQARQRLLGCTVPQLKERCRSACLPVSGRKDDLIARLVAVGDDGSDPTR